MTPVANATGSQSPGCKGTGRDSDGGRVAQETSGSGGMVASRFRLEDRLESHAGAGLWRAVDVVLSRNVAVHVVPADDPRSAAVLTAARTSATVSDGRILRVLDALEEGGQVFVVHEWGSGITLDRLLAEEPLEPRRAAWLVREVAEAVAVAHRHGIAHGRLVPENVMVTDAGSVKLVGFVVDAVLHGRSRTDGRSEHEADVRNLGALLYAALVGRWPGTEKSVLPQAPTVHGELCRPRQVRAGVPRPLDALCDRVLNGDPAPGGVGGFRSGRTQSPLETANDVCSALSEYLGDTLVTAGLVDVEPTVHLERPDLEAVHPAPADPEETQAARVALEDTQASAPFARPTSPAPREAQTSPGAVPVTWGPDRSGSEDSPPGATGGRPGSLWLRLASVIGVAALITGALVVALNLSSSNPTGNLRSGPSEASDTPTPSVVIAPRTVSDFDPAQQEGEPEEHPELVGLAVDGDEGTAWETYTYEVGPRLAPYKPGVGLLLDLGRETEVGKVVLTLLGGPHDVELLAAPEGSRAPTDTAGLTTVATRRGATGRATLPARTPVTTRYLAVWLTALPVSDDGYRGQVAEVVVRS